MVDHARIANTLGKMGHYLSNHNSICVGVSGGSDSNIIVHMIATYFREFLPKVHFVFCNTGLEYKATLKHLDYMESHYNIKIERIRGVGIITTCRKYGVPILSKEFSQTVQRAKNGAEYACRKVNGTMEGKNGEESRYNFTQKQKELALYLIAHDIPVSERCCFFSKKKPTKEYKVKHSCDLDITGERRCEGGQRATRHTECFEHQKDIDRYMPLFFWDDDTKEYYKQSEGVRYSDCYEIWGMKRTGCVGCPFNSRAGQDLELVKKYEPNLYKACINVFGESYRLMDKFHVHRHPIFGDEEQLKIDFENQGE